MQAQGPQTQIVDPNSSGTTFIIAQPNQPAYGTNQIPYNNYGQANNMSQPVMYNHQPAMYNNNQPIMYANQPYQHPPVYNNNNPVYFPPQQQQNPIIITNY